MNYNEESDNEEGMRKIIWAFTEMPVLAQIRKRFKKEKPLAGINISGCLHITTETANLAITLKAGGAKVALCGSNPLSTVDCVAHSLVKDFGISIFAVHGEDNAEYYKHVNQTLDNKPHITMDDGADLVSTIHKDRRELFTDIIAGTEETTTGVHRFENMEREGVLEYPIIAVNDANTKYLFDNRYGTGQSTIDGIIRATNVLLAGKKMVVVGYGWCGRGIAMRARGLGAHVIVTEVDPVRALEALMDGFQVMNMNKASGIGDIFVTATGNTSVIRLEHFSKMKNGAILCNSGHFNVEIDAEVLDTISGGRSMVRENVERYDLRNGNSVYLLADGRLVNLACAEGHPASVMDMSFANQSLCAEYIVENGKGMENRVYKVPEHIDVSIAEMKLRGMGVKIDVLSDKQKDYMSSWKVGT